MITERCHASIEHTTPTMLTRDDIATGPLGNLLCRLKSYNSPVYFCPNPGNAGDSLLACAALQLFDKHGITYTLIHDAWRCDPRNRIIIYGGGGNFFDERCGAAEFVSECHKKARELIVLPHTIVGCENLLSRLGSNVTVFCRDYLSLEHVRKISANANVFFDHDIAVCANLEGILAFPSSSYSIVRDIVGKVIYKAIGSQKCKDRVTFRAFAHNVRHLGVRLSRCRLDSHRVFCFRTDHEKTGGSIPPGNVDVSELFAFGMRNEVSMFAGAAGMVRFLSQFDEIHTNRLHVAISGGLLGKRVVLSANNYFKCRAIYESTLRYRFPSIHWADQSDSWSL